MDLIYISLANQITHHVHASFIEDGWNWILIKINFYLRKQNMIFINSRGDGDMEASFETQQESDKLLQDELMNAKLYDNLGFQYILDREFQRRIKNENKSAQDSKNK